MCRCCSTLCSLWSRGRCRIICPCCSIICDPLQSQSIAEATHTYAHLRGLELADYGTGEDNVEVDILVGSDKYWSLVSGRVVRGEHGPIAIETKLG